LNLSPVLYIIRFHECYKENKQEAQCTEVHFYSFFSGGFIAAIVVNPPERKLAKRTSLQCAKSKGRLLQLQIQALQVTECGYKNCSSKFIMAKPLKLGMLIVKSPYFNFSV